MPETEIETLTTPRLRLRPVRPSDAGLIGLYAGDIRVAQMTRSIPHPYPPGAAEAMVERIGEGRWPEEVWAIDRGGELIGLISLNPEEGELGYWVAPAFWGVGLASEAVEALTAHLLERRGLAVLTASAFEDNPASIRVLEKAGFVPVGSDEGYSVARRGTAPRRLFRCDPATRLARASTAQGSQA